MQSEVRRRNGTAHIPGLSGRNMFRPAGRACAAGTGAHVRRSSRYLASAIRKLTSAWISLAFSFCLKFEGMIPALKPGGMYA